MMNFRQSNNRIYISGVYYGIKMAVKVIGRCKKRKEAIRINIKMMDSLNELFTEDSSNDVVWRMTEKILIEKGERKMNKKGIAPVLITSIAAFGFLGLNIGLAMLGNSLTKHSITKCVEEGGIGCQEAVVKMSTRQKVLYLQK